MVAYDKLAFTPVGGVLDKHPAGAELDGFVENHFQLTARCRARRVFGGVDGDGYRMGFIALTQGLAEAVGGVDFFQVSQGIAMGWGGDGTKRHFAEE